jgi:hypothetical protein
MGRSLKNKDFKGNQAFRDFVKKYPNPTYVDACVHLSEFRRDEYYEKDSGYNYRKLAERLCKHVAKKQGNYDLFNSSEVSHQSKAEQQIRNVKDIVLQMECIGIGVLRNDPIKHYLKFNDKLLKALNN